MTSTGDIEQTEQQRRDAEIDAVTPDWGWKGLGLLAAVLIAGGVLALFNPFAASLTVEVVAGIAFMAAGITQLWIAVAESRKPAGIRMLSGVLGLLLVALAVSLAANPLAGLVTLTLTVAVLFAAMGVMRVVIALSERPNPAWGWILASGVISLVLAGLIVLGLPEAALGLLGLFLGIDLLFSGAMTLVLAAQAWRNGRG
ncbi:MAG: DUF308 domain-containing protein [Roseovarius sp.]